jgi:DNA-binding CsgD family transcriptional regulator/tetratricopeptide (TPR) repeat protein
VGSAPGEPAGDAGRGALPRVNAPRFVGRDAELRRLIEAFAREPALVLIEGEAGIGKSRLIREVFAAPAMRRHRPLVAACPPFREALTLAPVVDAIRQARTSVAGLRLSALAGTLRPLFPEWADDLPPAPDPLADAGAARHRLMRALAELLDRIEIDVLVVEDVHWADDATVDFLLFITARQAARVSLVLSYRPEDVPPGSLLPRLLARPAAGAGHARIALGALGVPETSDLVSSMLDGEHVSEDFATFLHERTDGVPLAVEESVRLLRDRSDLIRQRGGWIRRPLDDIAVPPTIRDAVAERAARLGPDAQRMLRAAAVLGEPAAETTLIAVGDLPGQRARDAVDEALSGGLLVEDGSDRIAFRHVLAARAVYDGIPGRERRAGHQRAGQALTARQPPPVARLAYHFREAGDIVRWRHRAEQAADLALASGDHQAAVAFLHELLTGDGLPGDAVARLAQKMPVFAFTGYIRRADIVSTLRTVLDSGILGVQDRAEVRSQLGRMLMHAGEYTAGAAELERAIPDLDRPLTAARAMMVLGRAGGAAWPASTHRRWIDRAAARLADAPVPENARLSFLVDRATGLLEMGDQDGWAVAAELPTTAGTPGTTLELVRGLLNIGDAAMRWGRHAEARRQLTSAIELAERHRYHRLRDMALVTLVHLDWYTGHWAGLAERAAALAELVEEPLVHLDSVLVTGLLDAACGTGPAARDKLGLVIGEGLRRGIASLPLEPAAALARTRLAEGDFEEALALTDGPIAMVVHKEIWLWATEIAPERVGALLAAGREPEARQLVAAFARGLRGRDAPAALAALDSCRALLAEGMREYARAADGWDRAATAWAALPQPYEALRARERQGGCLVAAGEREPAMALLTGAHRGLTDLGARGDADRVGRTLRANGVSPRPVWRGGRRGYGDQLSPRELEVVRLVLSGMTNPEIAQVLSRSPKTVAAQLNSAMRKYGVSSRTSLAVSATQAGLAPADPAAG